jgi:hypothetical protein
MMLDYLFDAGAFLMRTTLSIDDDVLEKAKAVAAKRRLPFRTVINEALRAGLKSLGTPPPALPYRTKAHKLGLRAGRNLDNIQELLAQVEGEDAR